MKVAVVEGGFSTEAEVSRRSAAALTTALGQAGHEALRLQLNSELPARLRETCPDVVFPIAHGAQGEDGCLQGLLEVLGLPYVGSDVRSSAVGADKHATKVFLRAAGIPVAEDLVLQRADAMAGIGALLERLREKLGAEIIVKPSSGGSTIGISRLLGDATADDLEQALDTAFELDERVVVESYLRGKEVTCSVLDEKKGPRALAVTLIETQASDWYDFRAKYAPGGSRHSCPAPLPEDMTQRLHELAVQAHVAVGARDLSRTDFIVDEQRGPIALEINTLPGMTDVSLFPEAARAAGIGLPELADRLVRRAWARAEGLCRVKRADLIRPLP